MVYLLFFYGTHYTLRGGRSGFNTECGISSTDMRYSISIYHNYYGAALSFRLSTHYAFRGSPSDLNTNCGMFSVAINYSSATTRWYIGAALL